MPQRLTFPSGPLLLLAALAALAMAARPLTPIDETRYVGVAWEMWLRGDWLLPFKNGEPYSHKPPLLFWIYNLGWLVTGVNEWWPRLISPLFSCGSLLLMLSIGRRLWPGEDETMHNAAWILSASLLWMLFSTSAMFDVMLAFFALLGAYGLLVAAHGPMRRGFAWLALGLGLGLLAKGPVVLLHLLPLAVLAPWWRPGLAWKGWYGGVLLALLGGTAIALAWAIPAALRGGEEYARMIFWGQSAGRITNAFAHQRPFWWYLPLLPLLCFPWLLWPTLWRRTAALRRARLDGGLRFCLAWLLPAFFLFSLISGKQIHYLVPLFPAFALFAGRLLADAAAGPIWLPTLAVAAGGAGMIYAALQGLPGKFATWENPQWWPGAALLAASLPALWLGRPPERRLVGLALLGAALYCAALAFVSGNLRRSYDTEPIAAAVSRLQARGVPVANNGFYHGQFHFAGRLRKPLEQLDGPADIATWFARHPDGVLILYDKPKSGETALFIHPYRGESAILVDADQARARGLLK